MNKVLEDAFIERDNLCSFCTVTVQVTIINMLRVDYNYI